MYTRRIRRYIIVPVIYVAVIFGLLYLQFSGTLSVRRSIGGMSFTGSVLPGGDETSDGITGALISFSGLVIDLSEDSPVLLVTEENEDTALVPVRYEEDNSSLSIQLSDGSFLRFSVTQTAPSELHISPEPAPGWSPNMTLVIPFVFDDDAEALDPRPGAPESLQVRFQERDYYLSAPPRTRFDFVQKQLFVPLAGNSRLIRYAELGDSRLNVVDVAFADGERRISDAFYTTTITEYLDLAYQGWGQTRFNGGSGTWSFREGSPRFSEAILTAYLAEAWTREEYTSAFNQMRRAADLHQSEIGLMSAVFLGNLRQITPVFLTEDQRRVQRLLARVRSSDPTVFRDEDLITFSANRGSEELYQAVVDFMGYVDFRNVGIPTAIGMLANAFDTDFPSQQAATAAQRFRALVEEQIIPSIVQFDDYFFIETSQGEIDVRYSIRAGQILERIGQDEDSALLIAIGRNLVLSGLSLADGSGYLPSLILFNEGGLQGQEGSFGPEELYPFFTENPNYPRMISLYSQLGAGAFVWTITDFTTYSLSDDRYTFVVRYPRNRTHYLIMQGIPPFTSMQLFGRDWRDDPTFEAYIKGRHYDARTRTLMIKYTDDSVQEAIILDF